MAAATSVVAAHFAALCHLGAAQLFCRRHALAPHALSPDDVKPRLVGHWGALPGVAYAIALASAAGPCRLLVGTGHSAGVVRAELWLRGDLPGIPHGFAGADLLCSTFGAPGGSLTELDPMWPGVVWTGGELGPALAIAAGAALAASRPIAVLTGDGEVETGVAAAAALAVPALASRTPLRLCWIINLNGWRMGGRSRLADLGPEGVVAWLARAGWHGVVARGDAAADAPLLAAALETANSGQPSLVVLSTEKGWTAPARLAGRAFRGGPDAHKLPFRGAPVDSALVAELAAWLATYEPGALFDGDGRPFGALAEALAGPSVFGDWRTERADDDRVALSRAPAAPRSPGLEANPPSGGNAYPIDGIVSALRRAAVPFLVTSPDELSSNRAHALADMRDGIVAETLSEEVCLAWLWGWTCSGRRGVFLTYEAFAPLVASQLAQYGKILAARQQDAQPSLVIVETSLGWHNTPTHANPDLVGMLTSHHWPFVRAWFPLDADDAATITSRSVAGNGSLELLVVSKHALPRYGARDLTAPFVRLVPATPAPAGLSADAPVPILAIGDLALSEACAASELLAEAGQAAAVVAVRELTALGDPSWRPGAPDAVRFSEFTGTRPGVAVTLTAPAPIASLLAERRAADRFVVLGYRDAASTTPLGTLLANGVDRWTIAEAVLDQAHEPAHDPTVRARWRQARRELWRASCAAHTDLPLPAVGRFVVRA